MYILLDDTLPKDILGDMSLLIGTPLPLNMAVSELIQTIRNVVVIVRRLQRLVQVKIVLWLLHLPLFSCVLQLAWAWLFLLQFSLEISLEILLGVY